MVVGFIQRSYESGWPAANTSSFKESAVQLGITLQLYDAAGQFASQVAAFHRFNADPAINVIVLSPVQSVGYDAVLRDAKAAGKIVVIEDGAVEADPSLYVTDVGLDFEAEGRKVVEVMCTLLKGYPRRHVVVLSVDPGSTRATGRASGIGAGLDQCGISVVDARASGVSQTDPKAVMAALLEQKKDIQGVFALGSTESVGAIEAIEHAGLKPGKDIVVVGFDFADADGSALRRLFSGELSAGIESNPLLAPQVYEAALRALNRDTTVAKWIPGAVGVSYPQCSTPLVPAGRPCEEWYHIGPKY
jgi:simple sugar transport system substrate-binding protein